MAKIRLEYVHEFRDRHGHVRRYLRRPGFKRAALPGLPGSVEFMAAYQQALTQEAPPLIIGAGRAKPGSVDAAVASYLQSAAFQSLAPEFRRVRRNILERFRTEHGDKPFAPLHRDAIERMVAKKAATPSAARNFLKTLRALMQHCIAVKMRDDDPTLGVKSAKIKSGGFRTWEEADIGAFEAKHPIGSRARLALALLLYTLQRRSDVVRMGRQHVRDGAISVTQQKTGTKLSIPIHPSLRAVLEATPSEHLTFLTTKNGKSFSPAGFTNWFREMCNDAGLPLGTSAHGLRKAGCRRLAEAGCSANVIASLSGHISLREVERYTKAADQARMAKSGMDTMVSAFPTAKIGTSAGNPS
jgi:integrase